MFKYFPHTQDDLKAMLEKVGVDSLDALYSQIPESIRFRGDYKIPSEMSEMEVRQLFEKLGSLNKQLTCFAGMGVYDHYTPSVIPQLLQRSEFLTSYTPYQAEISQGTLHYIFEYQSMMAELTGMDISNASMYDGTTAAAEAMMMAVAASKKARRVLIAGTMSPLTVKVMTRYAHHQGIELFALHIKDGVTDLEELKAELAKGDVAGMMVQQPNAFGIVEDYTGFAEACHEQKALFMMNCVAADLAIRKMPGRIVGMTKDNRDQRAFVLTLQAREQHIRRQKATSNICSNQSLMALFATIYCSLMGKQGLKEAAQLSYAGAHYLWDELKKTGRFHLVFDQPFFNEFYVNYDGDIETLYQRFIDAGILGGVRMENGLVIAVTEKRTKEEIDNFVKIAAL